MANTLKLFTGDDYDSNLIKQYFKSVYGVDGNIEDLKSFGFSHNEETFKSTMVLLMNNQFENKGKKERHKWSIFLFTKVDMNEYTSVFKTRKECVKIDKILNTNYLEYDVIQSGPYTGRRPNELQLLPEIIDLMQNCIFKAFLYHYSSLIINCNYYSVLEFCINNQTTWFTFQLNKNYALKNYRKSSKKKLLSGFSSVKNIEEEIGHITEKNRELSDLVDAYLGNLEFNEETEANYYDVKDAMLIKEKCILVEGYARTGKSIIALRLLHDYPEFDLLIMNYKFYHDLEKAFLVLGVEFPYNRIHHHSIKKKGFWNYSTRNGYLIVDEAQRLGNFDEDAIDKIFDDENHNETILLGDNNQFINPKYDYGLNIIKEKLIEKNIDIYSINFTESIGIPSNILKAIKKICYNDSFAENYSLNNFNVESVDDIKTFVDNYKNNPSTKKHMATIYMYDGEYYDGKVPGMTRYNMNYNSDDYFLEKNYVNNYYFSTFEMISRQVDVMYVYIPSNVYIENGRLKYEDKGEVYDQVLRNQLYVLMTRAQSSLTIYAENSEVREYLTETIKLINKKSDTDDVVLSPTDIEEIEILKKQIADRKITKILHFTDEKNVPSIMEKGLLSVKDLERNEIPFDRNDYQRLDGELGGVSLSIQKMNSYVLNDYKRKYPDKKYKLLVIDPAILYEIYSHEGNELAKRKYCQQNAAGNCLKSYEDFGILFPESVYIRNCDYYKYRVSELSNCPTDVQAEVLFFETIPPQYIKDIIDL